MGKLNHKQHHNQSMGTCTVQCAVDDTSCLVKPTSHDSPYLPRQGQCLPRAVAQQHPHIPGLLHHGELSPLTEAVMCMCAFVYEQGEKEEWGEWNGMGKGCATDEDDKAYSYGEM